MNAIVSTTTDFNQSTANHTSDSKAAQIFNNAYDKAPVIEFNEEWNNGTGYYDFAVYGEAAPMLAVGEVVAALSPMPDNRKLLMIGTPVGNVVVFQRYTDNNDIYVFNASMEFDAIVGNEFDRPLCAEDIERIFNNDKNIGVWIGDSTDPKVIDNIVLILRTTITLQDQHWASVGIE